MKKGLYYLVRQKLFCLKLLIRFKVFHIVLFALAIFLIARWYFLIENYTVNVLYWDQWGFYSVFFNNESLWDTFTYQHGPHRQGIGFLLTRLVAYLSNWDTKFEAHVIGTLILLGGILALWLKKRLFGSIKILDVGLFTIILTPVQYGLFVATPNISHGSMPFLLIILYVYSWTLKSNWKFIWICIINFLMIYTGFGFFIGPISIFLLIVDLLRSKTQKLWIGLSLLIVSLSLISFFIDYDFRHPDELSKEITNVPLINYSAFIFISLSNYWSLTINSMSDVLFGAFNFILIAILLLRSLWTLIKSPENITNRVIFILLGFSLLFLINLSLGRTPLGIGGAKASRYAIYITPAFIGLYFYMCKLEFGSYFWRLIFFVACLYPTFNMSENLRKMEVIKTSKMRWVKAYKQTENIKEANKISKFMIHPKPRKVALKKRLEYLKEHRLNLYKDDES